MPSIIINIEPMGKPRMTQRDKWKNRPVVLRWFAYKDEIKRQTKGINFDDVWCLSWRAYFSIPKSWSKKKKSEMMGAIHQQKPDRDNIDKAIMDAILPEDCGIASGKLEKFWDDGKGPRIELRWI